MTIVVYIRIHELCVVSTCFDWVKSVFSFPRYQQLADEWAKRCCTKVVKSSKICLTHFEVEDFAGGLVAKLNKPFQLTHPILKNKNKNKNAVLTIFLSETNWNISWKLIIESCVMRFLRQNASESLRHHLLFVLSTSCFSSRCPEPKTEKGCLR